MQNTVCNENVNKTVETLLPSEDQAHFSNNWLMK